MIRSAVLVLLLGAGTAAAQMSKEERESQSEIHFAVTAGHCSRAAALLNLGLARKYPSHYVIGATMYEEGLCLKANWERAERLYVLGWQAGQSRALHRLVAGLVRDARDPAAGLWWAQQAQSTMLPEPCRVPADVHANAERYIDALKAWPPGRLAACSYTVGVTAAAVGEVEYTLVGVRRAIAGDAAMTFVPAQARIEWNLERMTVGDGRPADLERFRRDLDEQSARALKRYRQPPDIDPDWRVDFTMRFLLE